MTFSPGTLGSTNLIGKQAGSPAITTANSAYAYTPSTGSSTTIGSITVNKTTTVNQTASGNQSYTWQVPALSNGVFTLNGRTSIGYNLQTALHTQAPYSVQVDFKTTTTAKDVQFILDNGEGFGIGWSEWAFQLAGNCLHVGTNSRGQDYGQAWYDYALIQINTWYRVGLMFYNVGGTYNSGTKAWTGGQFYIRGYLNGEKKFQQALSPNNTVSQTGTQFTSSILGSAVDYRAVEMPQQASNGIVIGADANNYVNRMFYGQIRNIFIGPGQLFWSI